MPLFSNNNNKLTMLNTLPLRKEKALQRLVEQNLKEALDMHFLASEYMTTMGGRIDTLAVDSDGAPTIIEYKRSRDDNVINQSFSYLRWLMSQRQEFFQMLMQKQLGSPLAESIKLDWKHPRLLCIAESFSKYDIDTVEVVPLKIDLCKFRYYENDIFSLDMINVKDQAIANIYSLPSAETNIGIIQSMKSLVVSSNAICAIFDELRERILGLDEYIVEKIGKRSIAYRLTKNFVEILIRKNRLVVNLRPIDFIDPNGIVEKTADGYLVTMNRRITIDESADINYVFGLIEQSYANVL